jgi:hypothetical protein
MEITEELRSSDYFLFVDFKDLSVFSHQELALAHNLGFAADVIALQEKGARLQSFLRYVQSNPAFFTTRKSLLHKVERLVRRKNWSPDYSRNLVIDPKLTRSGLVTYGDHTGQAAHETWKITIKNRRPDVAAVGVVCILDTIVDPSGRCRACPDRGYLKWVGHRDYQRTILPNAAEQVDLFAVRCHQAGLFLLSTLDVVPRQPVVMSNGRYKLNYKVFTQDFPMVEFSIVVDLRWQAPSPSIWKNRSSAKLRP